MEIRIHATDDGFGFTLIATSNGTLLAESTRLYANRRNALAAARLIAKSKIKVVEA